MMAQVIGFLPLTRDTSSWLWFWFIPCSVLVVEGAWKWMNKWKLYVSNSERNTKIKAVSIFSNFGEVGQK